MSKKKRPKLEKHEQVRDWYVAVLKHLDYRYPHDQPARVAAWLATERRNRIELDKRRWSELANLERDHSPAEDAEFGRLCRERSARLRAQLTNKRKALHDQ